MTYYDAGSMAPGVNSTATGPSFSGGLAGPAGMRADSNGIPSAGQQQRVAAELQVGCLCHWSANTCLLDRDPPASRFPPIFIFSFFMTKENGMLRGSSSTETETLPRTLIYAHAQVPGHQKRSAASPT